MTLPAVMEQYDEGARRAVSLGREEAHRLGHKHVGTEHLLLGLLGLQGGTAYRALSASGVTVEAARRKAIEAVGTGIDVDPAQEGRGDPPFSARAARALERATRFAAQRRVAEVGSGHVLLAVLDVEGTAGQVLRGLGVDVARLGTAVESLVDHAPGRVIDSAATVAGGDRPHVEQADAASAPRAPEGAASSSPAANAGAAVGGVPTRRGPTGATAGRESPVPAPNAPLRGPRCPSCASPLEGSLVVRPITPRKGGIRRDVLVAYCSACGSTLGVLPA